LLVVAAAGIAPDSFAEIFTCADAQGRTVFQDVPCGSARSPTDIRVAKPPRSATTKKEAAAEQPLERKRVTACSLPTMTSGMPRRWSPCGRGRGSGVVFSKGQRGERAWTAAPTEYLRKVFGHPDCVYERRASA
jgi:hypothetical protein